MLSFVLGIILLFAVGSCVIESKCRPDGDGNRYKWCSKILEKEKAK